MFFISNKRSKTSYCFNTTNYNNAKAAFNPTQATLGNDGKLVVKNASGTQLYTNTFTNTYNKGVTDADNRVNTASASYVSGRDTTASYVKASVARYNSGVNSWGTIANQKDANNYVDVAYNAGVTAADNRVNADSINYKSGYNAGKAESPSGQLGVCIMSKWSTLYSTYSSATLPAGLYLYSCIGGCADDSHGYASATAYVDVGGSRIASAYGTGTSMASGTYRLYSSTNVTVGIDNWGFTGSAACFVKIAD